MTDYADLLRDLRTPTSDRAWDDISVQHLRSAADAIEALAAECERLRDVLLRAGFVTCDAPACACGSWHHRYGLRERMNELRDALAEAGHPLCNENGNLPLNALRDLIDERDRLREELKAAQKDVERYRWLRDNARYWEWQPDFTCYFGITVGFVYKSTGYCDYSLEAAIDDAMSQDKRQSALDRMAEDERKLGMALDQEERDE